MELPKPEDESDRRLLEDVKKFGWHLISIPEDEEGPSYTFSVGLHYSFRHPELVLFGLGAQNEQMFVNQFVVERVKKGACGMTGVLEEALAESCVFSFTPFGKNYFRDYLGYARWFYHSSDFPAMQMVWSDRARKLPWDDGFDGSLYSLQPVLSEISAHAWPFRCAKNTAVFAHASVANGESPIRRVVHDDDGDWQFLDGRSTNESKNARLVSLESLVEKDPSLLNLSDLPCGASACRAKHDGQWVREERGG